MVKQVLLGGTSNDLSTTTSNNVAFWGYGQTSGVAFALPIPTAGKFRNLSGRLINAPGGGATRSLTLEHNGSPSALAGTFGAADTTVLDGDEVTVAAGDYVNLVASITGTPAASRLYVSLEFEPDDPEEAVLFGAWFVDSTADRAFCLGAGYQSDLIGLANERDAQVEAPLSGTITAWYLRTSAPTISGTYDFSLRSAMSSIVGPLQLTGTTNTIQATGLSIAFGAGDMLSVIDDETSSTGPGAPVCSALLYKPTVAGESMVVAATADTPQTAATEYNAFASGNRSWSTSQGAFVVMSGPTAWVLRKFLVRLETAPGTGDTRTFTVMGDGSPLTNSVSLVGAATTGQDTTHEDTIPGGTLLENRSTIANSPGVTNAICWGFVQFVGASGGAGNTKRRMMLGVG